jgi:reductive dehalogenase
LYRAHDTLLRLMTGPYAPALLAIALTLLVGFASFALISLHERERRAARVSFLAALLTSLPLVTAALLLSVVAQKVVLIGLGLLVVGGLVSWFLPVGRPPYDNGQPSLRHDERDIMFARGRLRPGSPEYDVYYKMRPENQAGDDRTRSLPGLLSANAERAEPVSFALAKACFAITGALREEVEGPVAADTYQGSPAEMTAMIKSLGRHLGARSIGVTRLQPYHIYTHTGRGTGTWGGAIKLEHQWAIAFSVEMDFHEMSHAPNAPVVAESARQYVEGARIALQLAGMIRELGYPARAHQDGNYQVIAPLVARDAGLGEIGRMGLLMTPVLGPRVRLGVVTTDLPLQPDTPGHDLSVIDFCTICKKCAVNCPTASIPSGDRTPAGDTAWRWQIDSETCFRYWASIGSDCGRCMRVCPYSHPDSPAHNLVRWAISHSGVARRVLLWMDDLFYGRKPK